MHPIMIYVLIFVAQVVQLALGTFRTILMARDEKLLNTILCFMQSIIGITATATVLSTITEDPIRAIFYIAGSAVGCYIGMLLDEKLALGQNMLTVVVDEKRAKELAKDIRDKGYAVTVLEGKGREMRTNVLMIATNRKKEKGLVEIILKEEKAALIIDESVSTIGGYY